MNHIYFFKKKAIQLFTIPTLLPHVMLMWQLAPISTKINFTTSTQSKHAAAPPEFVQIIEVPIIISFGYNKHNDIVWQNL